MMTLAIASYGDDWAQTLFIRFYNVQLFGAHNPCGDFGDQGGKGFIKERDKPVGRSLCSFFCLNFL